MSNLKNIARIAALVAALALSLSACGSEEESYDAMQETTVTVAVTLPTWPGIGGGNDVYYYSQVMPPSAAYPYGGYDGMAVDITIPANGNVWSSFDAMVYFDDFDHLLTDAERELLVLNLTDALTEQENRNLDLVQPGDSFTLLVPSVFYTPALEWPLGSQTPTQVCPAVDPCVDDVEPTPAPLSDLPDPEIVPPFGGGNSENNGHSTR